jgi:uncharacterized protein (UPF0212 family)
VWDPSHTLQRIRAQERARADGTLAAMVAKHGNDRVALRAAMCEARLVTMNRAISGVHCPECGTPMEAVYATPGITDVALAYEDVVGNFEAAIERTRRMR